jgi:predicted nucleotidyltransferase component of viral defense system
MDMDTTITSIPLTIDNAKEIVNKIINVKLDDGMTFTIKSIVPIMDEADYPGIRVILEAYLKKTRIPLKLDFSSGDVITPREITYTYKLLFEERSIKILAYNLETVLAEKFETIISKGTANSRMRDFYDVYTLYNTFSSEINTNVLKTAIHNTSVQRGSSVVLQEALLVVAEIENSNEMIRLWENYRKKFDYASDVRWNDVISVLRELCFILLRLP